MRKVASILAFGGLLLVAAVTEAPAVAFNSVAGTPAACTGVQVGCTGGVLQAITPVGGVWQPNNPGGSTAVWVSFANNTGQGGAVVVPNAPNVAQANATETFSFAISAGFSSLSLIVWADDTGGVRLDNGAAYQVATNGTSAPNPVQGFNCANGGLTCTAGGGSTFVIPLGGLAHTIQFDVFQRGAGTFGLMYQGDLTPVPEPATLLLVGSALAAAGFVSRRRLQKRQPESQQA
jgi:hypothetical protein